MTTPRINVDNHDAWGKLVKSWATGRDYVNFVPTAATPVPPETASGQQVPFAKPSSFKEMVTLCRALNVGMHFVAMDGQPKRECTGDEPIGFVLVQVSPESFVLRLPSKEMIHRSEAALTGSGGAAALDYALPPFYTVAFGNAQMVPMDAPAKMAFHAKRIGEYTINTCQ